MLDEKVLEYLQNKFNVNETDVSQDGILSNELTDEKTMKALIDRRTAVFGGTDIRAGGANMIRWFGGLFAARVYFYSIHNQMLSYDHYIFVEKGKKAEIQLISPQLLTIDPDHEETNFEKQIIQIITGFRPIFEGIAKISVLPIQQVWGLLCNPFYKGYFEWMKEATDDQQQILKNNLEVIQKIDPQIFGLKKNPFDLSFRYVENWRDSQEPIRIKGACCMSYLRASGNNCYSCPKMTKEQRAERGRQLRLQQQKKQIS